MAAHYPESKTYPIPLFSVELSNSIPLSLAFENIEHQHSNTWGQQKKAEDVKNLQVGVGKLLRKKECREPISNFIS